MSLFTYFEGCIKKMFYMLKNQTKIFKNPYLECYASILENGRILIVSYDIFFHRTQLSNVCWFDSFNSNKTPTKPFINLPITSAENFECKTNNRIFNFYILRTVFLKWHKSHFDSQIYVTVESKFNHKMFDTAIYEFTEALYICINIHM